MHLLTPDQVSCVRVGKTMRGRRFLDLPVCLWAHLTLQTLKSLLKGFRLPFWKKPPPVGSVASWKVSGGRRRGALLVS